MKKLNRSLMSRTAAAFGRRQSASKVLAPNKLNYANAMFPSGGPHCLPLLNLQRLQDGGTHSSMLACVAITLSVAATAAITMGRDGWPQAEPELYVQNDRRFDQVYDLAEQAPPLGSGSYGTVSAAVHKETGEVVAVKRIPRSPEVTLKEISAEVEVLKIAGEHRNITQFYELFADEDYYYLTMEMAKGGELFDLLLARGPPTEAQTAMLMKALVAAVAYVHMHGIIHGDIKPENVFLSGTSTGDVDWEGVLLGDFGSAVEVASGGRTTLSAKDTRVTVAYSPPETLRRALNGDDLVVSPGGDVWALGVLLYMLLTGEHPFAPDMSISDEELADNVMQDVDSGNSYTPFYLEHPEGRVGGDGDDGFEEEGRHAMRVSPLAMDLVSMMLRKDPLERPTAQEILKHPWFRQKVAPRDPELLGANAKGSAEGADCSTGGSVDDKSSAATTTAATDTLQNFWSGRRRLKGCLLAVMAGLVDGVSEESDDANEISDDDDSEVLEEGSTALRHKNVSAGLGTAGTIGDKQMASEAEASSRSQPQEGRRRRRRRRRRSIQDLERSLSKPDSKAGTSSRMEDEGDSIDSHPPEDFIGSRTMACRIIDRGGKGYITAADLAHVMRLMGEDDVTEEMLNEMMKAVDGDPSTESRRVTYEQMARLVPPLCPARKFRAGQELYKEGDVDPTFYLLRKGVVDFSVSTPAGKVPLQTQGPGASFGEVELLRADGSIAPRLATCRCLGRPGKSDDGCEALVMRGHMFALLTDVFHGVRARLGTQAEDRLTQLAGSVLQNGFSGYRRDVQGGEIIWDVHHRSPGFSPDTVGKSAVMPSRVLSTTEAINPPSASPLAAAPALAFRGKGASPRVANKKRDKRSAKLDESPFALLVLEGSITAVFESETGKGRVKHSIRREQVLEPGQFCFCGKVDSFGHGAPEAPTSVTCRPSQQARVLLVPAAEFRALMEKRNMAALTEFMLDQ